MWFTIGFLLGAAQMYAFQKGWMQSFFLWALRKIGLRA